MSRNNRPPPKVTVMAAAGAMSATSMLFGTEGNLPRTIEIDVDKIDPNPFQPRRRFKAEAIEALALDIEENTLLQPILVQPGEGGRYTLVAGERRWRAHQFLGKKTIIAIQKAGDLAELALIENIQREDLHPIEVAWGLRQLQLTHDYSQRDLARAMKKFSLTEVNRLLGLLALPQEILDEALDLDISKSVLAEISNAPPEEHWELWKLVKSGATVADLRTVKDDGPTGVPTSEQDDEAVRASEQDEPAVPISEQPSTVSRATTKPKDMVRVAWKTAEKLQKTLNDIEGEGLSDKSRKVLIDLRDRLNRLLDAES